MWWLFCTCLRKDESGCGICIDIQYTVITMFTFNIISSKLLTWHCACYILQFFEKIMLKDMMLKSRMYFIDQLNISDPPSKSFDVSTTNSISEHHLTCTCTLFSYFSTLFCPCHFCYANQKLYKWRLHVENDPLCNTYFQKTPFIEWNAFNNTLFPIGTNFIAMPSTGKSILHHFRYAKGHGIFWTCKDLERWQL